MRAKIWLYPGMAGWHFVTLPKKYSAAIQKNHTSLKRGWGSVPVYATIGDTRWKTSIFPDRKNDTYLLPLKAQVRKREDIYSGDTITFSIEIGR